MELMSSDVDDLDEVFSHPASRPAPYLVSSVCAFSFTEILFATGMHKPQAPGRHGDKVLYGDD